MFNNMLISLVLPFAIFQVANALGGSSRVCNDPKVTAAGDVFFKGYYEAVKLSLNDTIKEDSYLFRRVVRPMFQYVTVANDTCYHDTFSFERDGIEYNKFMQFSLSHGFKEFVANGGVKCIIAVKDKINACVKNVIGEVQGLRDKYHNLWKGTGLDIGYQRKTCKQVIELKNCTQHVIRNEGYDKCPYDPNRPVYVGSLFEFVIERCRKTMPGFNDAYIEAKLIDASSYRGSNVTTNILLGVLIVLLIILLSFVIFRYCRDTDQPWKLNALFTLRNRSQTQLHNEVDAN